MNKIFITGIIAILVIGGLIFAARPDGTKEATAAVASSTSGVLVVEEANKYDFGVISMAAGTVAHTFTLKNMGSEPVTLQKIYTSCMCTTAELAVGGKQFGPYGMPGHSAIPRIDQLLNQNEEATIAVVFDPAAHGPAGVGRITRSITIENNAGRPIELIFSATVKP